MNTAYFVNSPRRIEELRGIHLVSRERAYEIAAEVELNAMDYENFVTDMLADRAFIEEAAGLCSEGEVMRRLFVHRKGEAGGVLVTPERGAFVKWAALKK